jgi:Fic family protein
MNNYSEKLARILAASGWSQEDLSDRLDVSFVTLNKWINSKAEPRVGAKERIDLLFAEILGADEISREDVVKVKRAALAKKFSIHKLTANRKILDRITVNLTYHSNATEGGTMTESDVEAVIFDNKVLKNRTAVEQREAINHQTALNFLLDELQLQGKDFSFTPELLKAAHLRLMNGVISNAGEYRNHGARISGSHVPLANFISKDIKCRDSEQNEQARAVLSFANFIKIPELIKLWCERINEETSDPIHALAVSHAEFERIHPFSDGNGRTGRLLLFVKALQLGLVPPVINKERHNAYYKYLEIYQTKELSDPLEKFIAEAIIETDELIEEAE